MSMMLGGEVCVCVILCGVSPSSVLLETLDVEDSGDVDVVVHKDVSEPDAGHSLDAGNGPAAKHQTLFVVSSSFVYAHPPGQSESNSLNLREKSLDKNSNNFLPTYKHKQGTYIRK